MSEFEQKIDSFIEKLTEFESTDLVFNPWRNSAVNDKGDMAKVRAENLRIYMNSHKNAKYILLGESPSYGASYTGIAMTSEEVINKYPEIFEGLKTTSVSGNIHENTASMVWAKIKDKHEDFILWNTYAYNTHNENLGPRTPTTAELKQGREVLEMFLNIFKGNIKTVIALGKTTEKTMAKLDFNEFVVEYVRHPSCGGKRKFEEQIEKYLSRAEACVS